MYTITRITYTRFVQKKKFGSKCVKWSFLFRSDMNNKINIKFLLHADRSIFYQQSKPLVCNLIKEEQLKTKPDCPEKKNYTFVARGKTKRLRWVPTCWPKFL